MIRTRNVLPTDLISLQGWYDSNDLTTITKDGSNIVSQWNDKSGKGNNIAQSTPANRPTYNATGFNGKPSISFDRTKSQYLESVSNFPYMRNFTYMVVCKLTAFPYLLLTPISKHGNGFIWTDNGSTLRLEARNSTDTGWIGFTSSGVPVVKDTNYILTATWGETSAKIYINDGSPTSAVLSDTALNTAENLFVGRWDTDRFFGGEIAEIAIFNKVLTDEERIVVKAYLTNKWGL